MKSAQDILADEAITRLRLAEEEKEWDKLVRRCRYPRGLVPLAAQVTLGTVLVVVFGLISAPGDHRYTYIVAGALLFFSVPMHIFYLRRRERALLTIVQQHAPDLYARLKREDIA